MKTLIMTGLMLLASAAYSKEQLPLDVDCNKMATNAKSFAQLKSTGVATTIDQFSSFVVSPTVQTYPIRSILNYVFESSDKSPDQIYTALYGRCVQMGYKDLLEYFTEREAYTDIQAKLAEAQAKLAASEKDRGALLVTVTQLRQELATPPARRHNVSLDTIQHGTQAAH